MRANARDTKIAYYNDEAAVGVNWAQAPLMDAPVGGDITLSIMDEDIAIGRMQHSTCMVANSCTRENILYKQVFRDAAHIGAFVGGTPVRLRYRTGELAKKFDDLHARVVARELDLEGLAKGLCELRTTQYVLKAPKENQTLIAKRARNKVTNPKRKKASRTVGKRDGNRDKHGYLTRGKVIK